MSTRKTSILTVSLVVVLVLALAAAICLTGEAAQAAGSAATTNAPAKAKFPRLVDLGADKCIPCKQNGTIAARVEVGLRRPA